MQPAQPIRSGDGHDVTMGLVDHAGGGGEHALLAKRVAVVPGHPRVDALVVEAGGLVHVESETPRLVSNAGEGDLYLLVVGGKGGYIERDGHLVDPDDLAKRQRMSRGDMSGGETQ